MILSDANKRLVDYIKRANPSKDEILSFMHFMGKSDQEWLNHIRNVTNSANLKAHRRKIKESLNIKVNKKSNYIFFDEYFLTLFNDPNEGIEVLLKMVADKSIHPVTKKWIDGKKSYQGYCAVILKSLLKKGYFKPDIKQNNLPEIARKAFKLTISKETFTHLDIESKNMGFIIENSKSFQKP